MPRGRTGAAGQAGCSRRMLLGAAAALATTSASAASLIGGTRAGGAAFATAAAAAGRRTLPPRCLSSAPLSMAEAAERQQRRRRPGPLARRVSVTPASLAECGVRIRAGGLVSFPTETVYGLGCHALDPEAVGRVFEAKERPRSDPLIVHVADSADALRLWDGASGAGAEGGEGLEGRALRALAAAFWPGPLTIVARAVPEVPPSVMAGTGHVACRCPSHPIARALIVAAGVPIAAPSANKFGHVSPTRPGHVMDDLGEEDVWVVDPALGGGGGDEGDGGGSSWEADGTVCDVGVESTVARVEIEAPDAAGGAEPAGRVVVLRHGAVSAPALRRALAAAGLAGLLDVVSGATGTAADGVATVAPGQTVRHYSPDVPSYLVRHGRYEGGMVPDQEGEADLLARAVVIDYGGRLGGLRGGALAYRDLSPGGDSAEAAAAVFDALRWSERVEGAERVYFPELVAGTASASVGEEDALALAVKDRLTRAASGVAIDALR